MTRYQLHVQNWKDCDRCFLSKRRSRVCHLRGKVPCDVLFVGEAPGKSEDVLGKPFVGPAGQLLDRIVADAIDGISVCSICDLPEELQDSEWSCRNGHGLETEGTGREVRTAFTNLVGCVPLDGDGKKTEAPDDDCVAACSPRLREIVEICRPKLVVRVGKLATDFLTQGYKHSVKMPKGLEMIDVVHPAAVLRAPTAQQGLMIRRVVVTIRKAVEKMGS